MVKMDSISISIEHCDDPKLSEVLEQHAVCCVPGAHEHAAKPPSFVLGVQHRKILGRKSPPQAKIMRPSRDPSQQPLPFVGFVTPKKHRPL